MKKQKATSNAPNLDLKKLNFYFNITGFGRFAGIDQNPTTYLVKFLEKTIKANPIKKAKIGKVYVMTTAIEDCDKALEVIYNDFNIKLAQDPNTVCISLHFGVWDGCG